MCNIAHFFVIRADTRLGWTVLIGKYGNIDEDTNARLASGEGALAIAFAFSSGECSDNPDFGKLVDGSDSWIGTEPTATNATGFLSGIRHGGTLSPHHEGGGKLSAQFSREWISSGERGWVTFEKRRRARRVFSTLRRIHGYIGGNKA